ncbi:MAG: fluoride efflux transporter CrcB [Flavobacteriales bacterium]|nr:fluoride efflux transporter CrcB [Flavobacteriales bacterium]MCB9167574.1 fluoride efflux transporter CrcB [Flavobacteriales bacterium]
MNVWFAVFLGGGLGSLVRYAISRLFLWVDVRGAFPWATFTANMLATAMLAVLVMRWQHVLQERDAMRAFLAVGFCGGFSTFSTFSYENFLLLREGLMAQAALNVLVSVIAGLAFFYILSRSL